MDDYWEQYILNEQISLGERCAYCTEFMEGTPPNKPRVHYACRLDMNMERFNLFTL